MKICEGCGATTANDDMTEYEGTTVCTTCKDIMQREADLDIEPDEDEALDEAEQSEGELPNEQMNR